MKYGRLAGFRVSDLDENQSQVLATFFDEVDERLNIPIPTGSDSVPGPTNFLLIDPKVGQAITRLGTELNAVEEIPLRLRELVILVTAREMRCETEWAAHTRMGRAVGLTEDEMSAILRGEMAPSLSPTESIATRLVRTLVAERDVPDALYDEAVRELGTVLLFDIVMMSAFYTLMAYPMTAFRAPLPQGAAPVF